MYQVEKTFEFYAWHQPSDYDTDSTRKRLLRGNTWKMTLVIEGENLIKGGPYAGMLISSVDVERVTGSFIRSYLNEHDLSETSGLEALTTESLSEWVYNRLEPLIRMIRSPDCNTGPATLASVRIEGSQFTTCTYTPPPNVSSHRVLRATDQNVPIITTVKGKRSL